MDDQTRDQEIFNCPHCGYSLETPGEKCPFCGAQTHIRLPVDNTPAQESEAPEDGEVSVEGETPAETETPAEAETPEENETPVDGEAPIDGEDAEEGEPEESDSPLPDGEPEKDAPPETDDAPRRAPAPPDGTGIFQTEPRTNTTKLGFGIALLVIGILEFLNCLITIVTETEAFDDPARIGGYTYSAPFTAHETVVIWALVFSVISAAAGIFLIFKSKYKKE